MTNQKKKLCAYAAIAATLTLSPLAAFGQTSPATSPARDTATTSQTTSTDDRGYNRENHHNYGWIGLLGLLGLTGLMRKRDNYNRVDYTARTDDRRSTAGARS
jgi:glycerol uptake facilitator-like aquaporin